MNRLLYTLGLALVLSPGVHAQERPNIDRGALENVPPILRLALRMLPKLQYAGTRIVELMEGPNRQSHTEYVLRSGPLMRLRFPNQSPFAGQVIVENGRQRKHYLPGKNEIHIGPAKREEAFGRLVNMLRQGKLRFASEPGGQIAGQNTVLVTMRDGKNVVQKMWIDSTTGMLLRRDLFDPVGARVGSYEFTEINYTPVIKRGDFELVHEGARIVTPIDEAKDIAQTAGLAFISIPASEGFGLESTRLFKAGRLEVMQQSYNKPGAGVSLFQARGAVELPIARRAAKGGMKAVTWSMNGNTFALMGNLPEAELNRIARLLGMN